MRSKSMRSKSMRSKSMRSKSMQSKYKTVFTSLIMLIVHFSSASWILP
jgi:hypothetical protein